MNRLLFLFAAGISLAFICTPADACNRCGLFGHKCRYAAASYSYAAPVVVAQQPDVQNFVFNNSFPVPILAAGNSAYGYSLASAAYQVDASQLMDRAARFTELAIENGREAASGFNATAATALAVGDNFDRRQKNTLLALSAMQANDAPAASSSFQVTVQGGQLSVKRLDVPAGPSGGGGIQALAAGTGFESCAKCHNGSGANGVPKAIVLDGTVRLDPELYAKAVKAVRSGKMPPESHWTAEQKLSAVSALAELMTDRLP